MSFISRAAQRGGSILGDCYAYAGIEIVKSSEVHWRYHAGHDRLAFTIDTRLE